MLASLHRIVHDLGVTVVLAEHRLERVVHHADRVVLVDDGHTSALLDPAEAMLAPRSIPPVVGLSRLAGWAPTPCRSGCAPPGSGSCARSLVDSPRAVATSELRAIGPATEPLAVSDLRVVRAGRVVLDELDLSLAGGR